MLEDLKSPSKNKHGQLCDGRNIINLGKTALADVRVLSAMATSWMKNNVIPSGKSWDDLYSHLKKEWRVQKPRDKGCVGWICFVVFSKFNPQQKIKLDILSSKGQEGDSTSDSNWSRGKIKNRQLMNLLGNQSPFKPRGLIMATRVQVIEVAQMKDAKG